MKLSARYYDGQTANALMVEAHLADDGLHLRDQVYAYAELTLSPKLGSAPRFVDLPDGGRLECNPQQGLDTLAQHLGQRNVLNALESHWLAVLVSITVAVAFMWGGMQYGVPALAKSVAMSLPQDWVQSSDEYTLKTLDKAMFEASTLNEARQQELSLKFHQLKQATQTFATLVFRSSPRGANAFALPGGTVVMTDELVALAKHDDEILSVLAHELGHIQYRHGLRHTLQASALTLILTAVTGDLTGLSSVLVNVPVVLMSLNYGREMEAEADGVAYEIMTQLALDPIHFANIMQRLHEGREQGPQWLSSHPASEERIKRFQQ